METRRVDVAVIGAGTAGMTAFHAARKHTDAVVLIEGDAYGTTCARVGCMPSKLLIAAADAAHAAREADGFGVHAGGVTVDGAAVLQRVRLERDRFVQGVLNTVDKWPEPQKLHGRTRFIAPGVLQVGDDLRLEAGRVVIATGASPHVPDGWREALGDRLALSDDVFEWSTLPESVAVVGAGVIGLEIGQALHRLGVRVTVFDRGGPLGPVGDPEIAAAARAIFAGELHLATGAEIETLSLENGRVRVDYAQQGQRKSATFERLLAATGRRPNVSGLDLHKAGAPLDQHGVPESNRSTCQVGDLPLFIAGDAAAHRMLLHEAADEGRIAGDNAGRWPDVRVNVRRALLSIAFTDPQMAVVGEGHEALKKAGINFATGLIDFATQGRSRVMRQNRGLLHLYGEHGSGRFLGAEMAAPEAEHLAHLLAWALHDCWTVQQLIEAPYYHPTAEEGLRGALRELQRALHMGPPPVPSCLDCGPGG